MRETKIEKWYCDELAKYSVAHVKLGQNGWPDQMFVARPKQVCFVEFKATNKKVERENQKRKIKELREMFFTVFEINEKSEIWLEKILRALRIDATL